MQCKIKYQIASNGGGAFYAWLQVHRKACKKADTYLGIDTAVTLWPDHFILLSLLSLCSHCTKSQKLKIQMWVEGLVTSANRENKYRLQVFDSQGCWLNQSALGQLGS